MPGNPKECRRNAARCAELAVAAHTPQLRARFLELSKNWEKLVVARKRADRFPLGREQNESNKSDSVEDPTILDLIPREPQSTAAL